MYQINIRFDAKFDISHKYLVQIRRDYSLSPQRFVSLIQTTKYTPLLSNTFQRRVVLCCNQSLLNEEDPTLERKKQYAFSPFDPCSSRIPALQESL